MDSVTEKRCITGNRMPIGSLFSLSLLLLLIALPSCSLTIITWLPNVEWTTASNWADGIVPQNGTRVVFPVEMRLSVGLPAQNSALDLAGLELPRDGSLVFPETGMFTISQTKESAKTAHWSLNGPLLWADPNNWDSERSIAAVPHVERIPCQDDVVMLPGRKRTISMQLPNTPETVKAVRLKDDTGNLPIWEWNSHLQGERNFFSGPKSIRYTDLQTCSDCPCQPESIGREILNEVCNTRGGSCPELECEYPVKVEGHCCYYCGARVVLSDRTTLSLSKRVANLALENFGSTLSWYTRRTWDSKTEILIAGKDKYSAEKTAEGIATLTSVLREQGIDVVNIDMAGDEVLMSRRAAVLGPFFGTLLVVMVLVLIALPYYGYPLRQVFGESWQGFRELINTSGTESLASVRDPILPPRNPFRFAKFENAPDSEVELAARAAASSDVVVAHVGLNDEDDEDDDEEGGGGRFANPLYRSGRRQPEVQTFAALQKLHDDTADEEVDLSIDP